MIVFPNAKINIGLHVTERRPDGYHNLETVFVPVALTDALEMAETGKIGITLSGVTVDGRPEENLVLKAYHLLRTDHHLPPVQFHLHKVIPPGAGLGGGSADAAFALRMLNDHFRLNLPQETLRCYAAQLGADCPFFIDNRPAFASGTGDQLTPVDLDLSGYRIVILKPPVAINTKDAYSNIQPAKPDFSLQTLPQQPVEDWKNLVKNDFEKTVFSAFPEIAMWKERLYDLGAIYASMSGSGSAIYGLFRELPPDLKNKIPKSLLLID